MDIGSSIKKIRKEKRITQKELAEKCGISVNALCQIETNVAFPHKATIENIAKSLEVPISYLLFFSISEEDVTISKRDLFKSISPMIESILLDSTNDESKAYR